MSARLTLRCRSRAFMLDVGSGASWRSERGSQRAACRQLAHATATSIDTEATALKQQTQHQADWPAAADARCSKDASGSIAIACALHAPRAGCGWRGVRACDFAMPVPLCMAAVGRAPRRASSGAGGEHDGSAARRAARSSSGERERSSGRRARRRASAQRARKHAARRAASCCAAEGASRWHARRPALDGMRRERWRCLRRRRQRASGTHRPRLLPSHWSTPCERSAAPVGRARRAVSV